MAEANLSINCSSGKGSHLLLVRLLGLLLFFGNAETGVEPGKLQQGIIYPNEKQITKHTFILQQLKEVKRKQDVSLNFQAKRNIFNLEVGEADKNRTYSLVTVSVIGLGKRGSTSQSRENSVPSEFAFLII